MDDIKEFSRLKEKIHKERGLDVNQYKENYLKRRLAVRMRALGLRLYGEYLKVLEKDSGEMAVLLDKLTINVTQFFRDPEVFIVFENDILPQMLSSGMKKISVWSAGCSSGEEPYSIAISIEETAEKLGIKGFDYEIHATDIDEAIIYKAIEGKYEGHTLDNVAASRRNKYFIKDGGFYRIKDSIKKKVKFIRANLMKPYLKEQFDFVFCRNVITYFSRELQKNVLLYFHEALKKGGIFFMGKTETMLLEYRDKFKCINIKERIFTKLEEEKGE